MCECSKAVAWNAMFNASLKSKLALGSIGNSIALARHLLGII